MKIAPYLLVLGAGTMQLPVFEEARKLGLQVIAADGNASAVGAEQADIFIPEDLKDPEGILRSLRLLGLDSEVAGVFTAGTDFSYSVALVAQGLGLPGILPEVALGASNKEIMRQKFASAGVSSPKFMSITEELFLQKDLNQTLCFLDFPLVIKPVDNMGSRGVQKVENEEQAKSAIVSALEFSGSKTAIIEEFIPGQEYSIDSLLVDGKVIAYAIAQRHVQFPPFFVETGHSFPSGLSEDEESKIVQEFEKGIRALGITSGAAKGDVFWDSSKAYIGEIAARLSGGYMSGWTLPYATGMNFIRAAIQIALGQVPHPIPTPQRRWYVQESALVSFPGKILSIEFAEDLEKIPGFENYFSRCKPGDILRFPRNNVEKAGNLIFASPSREVCSSSTNRALNALYLKLDPDFLKSYPILSHPDHPDVPQAYPRALSGNPDRSEVGWDGRTYDDALGRIRSYILQETKKKYLSKFVLFVLQRYGFQAGMLAADKEIRAEGNS